MSEGCCETCRWWGKVQDGAPEDHGACRVGPPRIVPSQGRRIGDYNDGLMGVWPFTAWYDWCGSHTTKPEEKPR